MTLPTVAERLELVARRRAHLERQRERANLCPGSTDVAAAYADAYSAYARALEMLAAAERRNATPTA